MSSAQRQVQAGEIRARVLAEIAELGDADQVVIRSAADTIRTSISGGEMHKAGLGHLALALVSVEIQEQLGAAS
jgi:RecA/RadA recombinase